MSQEPLNRPPNPDDPMFPQWLYNLWKRVSQTGQVLWSQINFTGSNITDIATRNHADLQNLNTASYTHLTSTQATDLTDGGDSTLHYHSADRIVATQEDETALGNAVTIDFQGIDAQFSSTTTTVANHHKTSLASGKTKTIPSGYQLVNYGPYTVDGTLTVNGDLIIL